MNLNKTINELDPGSKLTSFVSDVKYNASLATVTDSLYTILSDSIDVTAEDLVYVTATNADGV